MPSAAPSVCDCGSVISRGQGTSLFGRRMAPPNSKKSSKKRKLQFRNVDGEEVSIIPNEFYLRKGMRKRYRKMMMGKGGGGGKGSSKSMKCVCPPADTNNIWDNPILNDIFNQGPTLAPTKLTSTVLLRRYYSLGQNNNTRYSFALHKPAYDPAKNSNDNTQTTLEFEYQIQQLLKQYDEKYDPKHDPNLLKNPYNNSSPTIDSAQHLGQAFKNLYSEEKNNSSGSNSSSSNSGSDNETDTTGGANGSSTLSGDDAKTLKELWTP